MGGKGGCKVVSKKHANTRALGAVTGKRGWERAKGAKAGNKIRRMYIKSNRGGGDYAFTAAFLGICAVEGRGAGEEGEGGES